MKISFIGDVMLGRFVARKYKNSPYPIVDKRLVDHIKKSDYVIANLESPITTSVEEQKDHLVFQGSPEMLNQFGWVDCFSLSNNHINDCGSTGMDETIHALQSNGFKWNGLFDKEYEPQLINQGGNKIAIITCTDMMNREFESNTDWKTIRINDPILDNTIDTYKKKGYFLILYAHVGMLFSRFPNPIIREFAHEKIEKGVDLIVTVHPHVLGGMEIYKGKNIYYSLGDFVMDGSSFRRRLSGILTVELEKNELKNWSLDIAQINSNLQTFLSPENMQKKKVRKYRKVTQRLEKNRLNYDKFYKKQYKIEMLQHSTSTILFLLRSKGIIGLFRLLYVRLDAVKAMFKRVITDRSKMRYDTDAINHKKSISSDDIY